MKKVIFIVLPILLLGGGFVGLAIMGVVNVPGLTPPKKAKPAPEYGEAKDKDLVAEAKPKTPNPKTPILKPKGAPETDPEKGTKKLAQLWNNLPAAKLADVAKEFQDKDLAPILVAMDPEKVAELMGMLDAKRSAKLSKELQRVASIVPKPAG